MPLKLIFAFAFSLLFTRFVSADLLLKDGDKVAFLGDSITQQGWDYPGGYVKLTTAGLHTLGATIVPSPAGVSGNTSQDMLKRFQSDVLNKKPDWVTISCGVNDVWHGTVTLDEYEKNITSLVDQAQALGIKVLIMTSTPIGETSSPNNTKLAGYNDFLHQLAAQRHLPVAEENAAFQAAIQAGPPLPNNAPILTVDGVHPNPNGAQVMAAALLAGFGATPAQVDQVRQAWLDMPDSAVARSDQGFNITSGITIKQYNALKGQALAQKITMQALIDSLFIQAIGDTIQAHHADPLLDHNVIEHEAQQAFTAKVAALTK
jgi:lysophospholipase L1-like esterase